MTYGVHSNLAGLRPDAGALGHAELGQALRAPARVYELRCMVARTFKLLDLLDADVFDADYSWVVHLPRFVLNRR